MLVYGVQLRISPASYGWPVRDGEDHGGELGEQRDDVAAVSAWLGQRSCSGGLRASFVRVRRLLPAPTRPATSSLSLSLPDPF